MNHSELTLLEAYAARHPDLEPSPCRGPVLLTLQSFWTSFLDGRDRHYRLDRFRCKACDCELSVEVDEPYPPPRWDPEALRKNKPARKAGPETKTNAAARMPAAPRASRAFEALVKLEPGLEVLRRDCYALRRRKTKTFCANAVWYGYPGSGFERELSFKWRLLDLVGEHALSGHPVLMTDESRSIAMKECYAALPDCRGCGPFC